jgi:hypothetical protein
MKITETISGLNYKSAINQAWQNFIENYSENSNSENLKTVAKAIISAISKVENPLIFADLLL